MSDEDQMVSTLIDFHENKSHSADYDEIEYDFEPEAHYNYYGDRGIVDLYVREVEHLDDDRAYCTDILYEIKSAEAVEAATGANEILRQFHRMRRYFYMDEQRDKPHDVRFELCFVPNETTVQHVADNLRLYQSSTEKDLCDIDINSNFGFDYEPTKARVQFRQEGSSDIVPAHITGTPRIEVSDGDSWHRALGESNSNHSAPQTVRSILGDLGYGGDV